MLLKLARSPPEWCARMESTDVDLSPPEEDDTKENERKGKNKDQNGTGANHVSSSLVSTRMCIYIGICMQLKRETYEEINWALPCRSSCLHCVLRKNPFAEIFVQKLGCPENGTDAASLVFLFQELVEIFTNRPKSWSPVINKKWTILIFSATPTLSKHPLRRWQTMLWEDLSRLRMQRILRVLR